MILHDFLFDLSRRHLQPTKQLPQPQEQQQQPNINSTSMPILFTIEKAKPLSDVLQLRIGHNQLLSRSRALRLSAHDH